MSFGEFALYLGCMLLLSNITVIGSTGTIKELPYDGSFAQNWEFYKHYEFPNGEFILPREDWYIGWDVQGIFLTPHSSCHSPFINRKKKIVFFIPVFLSSFPLFPPFFF